MAGPLSAEEVGSFVESGYLVRHDVLDPALCARARDALWEGNQVARLRRDAPESWVGPFSEGETCGEPTNQRAGYRWQLRSIGRSELLLELLPRNPTVVAIADQLLGAGRYECGGDQGENTRGIYCTLPYGPAPRTSPIPACHIDASLGSRNRLGCVCYIDDCAPLGGGFGVWPCAPPPYFASVLVLLLPPPPRTLP